MKPALMYRDMELKFSLRVFGNLVPSQGRKHIEELFDLLPHESPSRGLGAEARSFGTGAYAKGPLQGLRKECGTFPQATKLLNAYVCCCFPDHTFTTSILFCNAKTDMHVDSRNHKSANAVMGISSFENGPNLGGGWLRPSRQTSARPNCPRPSLGSCPPSCQI